MSNLAPIDMCYTLKPRQNSLKEIPIKTNFPQLLYQNERTFDLVERPKPEVDIEKVQGFAHKNLFNPQKL